ncbi:hypothetical protein QZH41_004227 [Actinostola sp. cb2023]|nr:hypothetical protein QZH41_004227 [Actinostola sp. cb2023]
MATMPQSTPRGERNEEESKAKRNDKREAILRMMERLENEITANEENEAECTNEIKQYEMQIQTNNERLTSEEDEIQKLKENIEENHSKFESFERKLETVRFFLKKHEVVLDKIKQKLDENKNSASIKMELKEKIKEYETGKKDEDDLILKYQQTLDDIRSIYVEIRHRTEEIIRLEDHIHDIVLQVRVVKHSIHKNHRTKMELQEKLDNISIDLAETDRQKPMTPGWTSRSRSRLKSSYNSRSEYVHPDRTVEYKVLDYNELGGPQSTVIGRKGKGISPPQFNLPVGVAVDFLGHLHVADHGNGRVHVLDIEDGTTKRHPLIIGGKCRPCALTVSHRGDLVMTDSQIIRVFNNKGEFLRPILPVYGKNDRRPHLCSIAIDTHGCIYAGDRANHRIQKFTLDGKFLHFIGNQEEINYPIGIAVTKHGDVIVSDYVKHHLKIFAREKTLDAKTVGQEDTNGSVIVADAKNHRVQVFVRLVPIYAINDNEIDNNDDLNSEKDGNDIEVTDPL